jgi:hypothetical protein
VRTPRSCFCVGACASFSFSALLLLDDPCFFSLLVESPDEVDFLTLARKDVVRWARAG